MLPFLVLLAVTLLWFLLPLIPALRELYRPTDIAPLKVVDRSSGHVAYFARNFKQYLERALPVEAGAGDYSGRMLEGTEFVRINLRPAAITEAEQRTHNRIVVFDTPLTLEGRETFLLEVYARAPLVFGPRTVFRALYGDRELVLGEATQVLRWTHATGKLTVGQQSELRGRVSSDAAVVLGSGVRFERVGAPVISVGAAQEPPPPPPATPQSFPLPEGAQQIGDHVRIAGDLAIPEGVQLNSNLVVAGRLRLGLGAIVVGSVKAHREIVLGDEAQITGSVVSRTRIALGQAAWIGGAAIAEQSVRLGRDAVVGSPTQPATVAATDVELANGATVYGQISALRAARTL
ncbi:MAG TPA: hypothetical protein VGQ69_12670 [Gemmatimonadales bacterium]|nr:hypothetical protein [Gemmatimonadales bacterium]